LRRQISGILKDLGTSVITVSKDVFFDFLSVVKNRDLLVCGVEWRDVT
jgi:hypothetical protein